MDRVTAYRSFGKPGYSPAKGRVRIMDNKWYLVTFQNIERDSRTDYIGLGVGTYTELLPAHRAREARDAHLNHCNGITEYAGPIYEVWQSEYGYPERSRGYYVSESQAQAEVNRVHSEAMDFQRKCLTEAERHESYDAAKVIARARQTGVGTARVGEPEWVLGEVAWHRQLAKESRDAARKYKYSVRVDQIR